MPQHSHGSDIEDDSGFFVKRPTAVAWGRSYFLEYKFSILRGDLLYLMSFGAGVVISQGGRHRSLGRLMRWEHWEKKCGINSTSCWVKMSDSFRAGFLGEMVVYVWLGFQDYYWSLLFLYTLNYFFPLLILLPSILFLLTQVYLLFTSLNRTAVA